MKKFDFLLQSLTLLVYIVVSPFLFGILYPTTGDQALIWIWVVVVTGMASISSLVIFVFLNVFVVPEKTYKIKGLVTIALSTILMYNLGNRPNSKMEMTFLFGNIFLLAVLYCINGIVFFNRIKSTKKDEVNKNSIKE